MLVPDPRRGDRRRGGSGHPLDPARHGASRPAERHGARAEQAVRADSRGVQGSALVAELPRRHGLDGRRQVPRRRASRASGTAARSTWPSSMPPNPSHLEAVDPVVEGMARAAGTTVDRAARPSSIPARSLPILIHGDAAFPGQGIVAETLNLEPAARLRHRRHDSHHRQQPARVHGGARAIRTARPTRAAWRAASRSRSCT